MSQFPSVSTGAIKDGIEANLPKRGGKMRVLSKEDL
jgi:hypothetical protein